MGLFCTTSGLSQEPLLGWTTLIWDPILKYHRPNSQRCSRESIQLPVASKNGISGSLNSPWYKHFLLFGKYSAGTGRAGSWVKPNYPSLFLCFHEGADPVNTQFSVHFFFFKPTKGGKSVPFPSTFLDLDRFLRSWTSFASTAVLTAHTSIRTRRSGTANCVRAGLAESF